MGVSGQHHAPAALPPGKGPPVPIVQEAGWAPEPVWTQRLEEKSSDTILPELTRLPYLSTRNFKRDRKTQNIPVKC
jgi:hypothetical protein